MKRKRAQEQNGDAAPATTPQDTPRTQAKPAADDPDLTTEEKLKLKRQKEQNPDF